MSSPTTRLLDGSSRKSTARTSGRLEFSHTVSFTVYLQRSAIFSRSDTAVGASNPCEVSSFASLAGVRRLRRPRPPGAWPHPPPLCIVHSALCIAHGARLRRFRRFGRFCRPAAVRGSPRRSNGRAFLRKITGYWQHCPLATLDTGNTPPADGCQCETVASCQFQFPMHASDSQVWAGVRRLRFARPVPEEGPWGSVPLPGLLAYQSRHHSHTFPFMSFPTFWRRAVAEARKPGLCDVAQVKCDRSQAPGSQGAAFRNAGPLGEARTRRSRGARRTPSARPAMLPQEGAESCARSRRPDLGPIPPKSHGAHQILHVIHRYGSGRSCQFQIRSANGVGDRPEP